MITKERIMEELVAIATAKVTDYLFVEDGVLTVRQTEALDEARKAALASIEKTAGGLRMKFYDKLKALELIGRALGMFEGGSGDKVEENNLLQEIMRATMEEKDEIQALEQQAAAGYDLVEQGGDSGI